MINAATMVEPGLVSAKVRVEGTECEKDHVDEQLMMNVSASALVPNTENAPAKVASTHVTVAGDVALVSHHSRVIDHGAVCGLLLERL
jgi:hypothetical protein